MCQFILFYRHWIISIFICCYKILIICYNCWVCIVCFTCWYWYPSTIGEMPGTVLVFSDELSTFSCTTTWMCRCLSTARETSSSSRGQGACPRGRRGNSACYTPSTGTRSMMYPSLSPTTAPSTPPLMAQGKYTPLMCSVDCIHLNSVCVTMTNDSNGEWNLTSNVTLTIRSTWQ